jgi:hypothetical protein
MTTYPQKITFGEMRASSSLAHCTYAEECKPIDRKNTEAA